MQQIRKRAKPLVYTNSGELRYSSAQACDANSCTFWRSENATGDSPDDGSESWFEIGILLQNRESSLVSHSAQIASAANTLQSQRASP